MNRAGIAVGCVAIRVRALTVTLKLVPAVLVDGAVIFNRLAAAALTSTPDRVPVMVAVAMSRAVIDLVPAVLRMAVNVAAP